MTSKIRPKKRHVQSEKEKGLPVKECLVSIIEEETTIKVHKKKVVRS